MKTTWRFSARETLLGHGSSEDKLRRCFGEAWRYLETTSPEGLLGILFASEERRRQVLDAVANTLHVGFLVAAQGLTVATMGQIAAEAGFTSLHSTSQSTVVARELGRLAEASLGATMIFSAHAPERHSRCSFLEAFVPSAAAGKEDLWIDREVGTHVGLTLADSAKVPAVQDAFLAEGFRIPPFMEGRPIANPSQGVSVVYFERDPARGDPRIEIVWDEGARA